MRASVATVHAIVTDLAPGDALEAEHRREALRWLESTDDVFRRVRPAAPPRHLVSYVVLVDPADGAVLLVDHLNAGLWLPPGGHVDPDEDPALTAVREAKEELGIDLTGARPRFLTITGTVGEHSGHTDVSLWYVGAGHRGLALTIDLREFREARWWSPADVRAADPAGFDPHLSRFLAKTAAN